MVVIKTFSQEYVNFSDSGLSLSLSLSLSLQHKVNVYLVKACNYIVISIITLLYLNRHSANLIETLN
jgi:hypothetical protein